MAKAKAKQVSADIEGDQPALSTADDEAQSAESIEAGEFDGGFAVKLKRHSGEGLYRAGLHFPKGEVKKFKAGELSVDKLAMLIAEPKLEVFQL